MHNLLLLKRKLQRTKEKGLLRFLKPFSECVDLTSNDYFGFAKEGLYVPVKWQGATGSRLLTGNHPFYQDVEEAIAQYHKAESCLIANTGYTANLGLITALGMREVTFIYDEEIHASMMDGMRLSKAQSVPFRHNDLSALEDSLKSYSSPIFVLVESVYSISGDIASLPEIVALCNHYGADLIVDEAHATGLFGPKGEGLVVEYGLESQVFARVHTFSKALGAHGACILGCHTLKEYLINYARPFIYTTALPISHLVWIKAAYEKLRQNASKLQSKLKNLMTYFHSQFQKCTPLVPIQPIYIKGMANVRSLSYSLQEKGLDVRAILPPTVAFGKECLRVVLHSFNTTADIDRLKELLYDSPYYCRH